MYKFILSIFLLISTYFSNAQVKVLFDASKAETAGNADWVIDADLHNIKYSGSTGLPYISTSTTAQSNPQRIPTPAQSGITTSTAETYWTGALSSWGIDCVNKGYIVETLPYNGVISYGNSSNAQDLSNYKVFVVDEPNIKFTTAEMVAMMNFVQNGGGLFMISDHNISDRNNDGWDSPHIWRDFFNNNTVKTNPFGIMFDTVNISPTSSNVLSSATDSLLHGSMGNVTQIQYSNGTTMSIDKTANASAKGIIFTTGSSTTGNTNALCAYARYGQGKVVAVGDSSPFDDGTGNTSTTLYSSYATAVSGNHKRLIMNATIWLATSNPLPVELSSLTAAKQFDNILINWQTATEINTSYFNVQKSNNGSVFNTIGNVKAKGNSSYSFTDANVNSLSATNYYRLEIVDNDGSRNYSKIVEVNTVLNNNKPIIYPNPANDLIYFTKQHIKQVKVYNSLGKIVMILNNIENDKAVDISNLTAGLYFVEVITPNGEIITNKLLKK